MTDGAPKRSFKEATLPIPQLRDLESRCWRQSVENFVRCGLRKRRPKLGVPIRSSNTNVGSPGNEELQQTSGGGSPVSDAALRQECKFPQDDYRVSSPS